MSFLGTKVSFATTTLSYPIFAAEFDPYNRGYLVVGGGGGESRSGVPNQISVLDVSNRATISSVVDIDLSRDEDSVQSLGSLATKDGLITFAGINSSQADQNANKNEHFRAFDIKLPPRKKQKTGGVEATGRASLLGKRSLFKPDRAVKKEAYQRILRLSPAQKSETGSKRIGAIASGMSKPAEIVVFSATTALPDPANILTRIETDQKDEVLDLDIAIADKDRFSVAWCTDYDICEQTLEYDFDTKMVQKTPKGPRRVHQVPVPADSTDGVKPKFRSVRFLDAENILALVNRPGKMGAELHIYHLYPTGPASTVLQMSLPSHIKQAVSMDVCVLDADPNGNKQIVVAVAGQDISIESYVLDFKGPTGTFSRFHSFQTFRDVHKHQMTKICFSPFHAPGTGESKEQYIRLASVSYGNTVVVDSFPLKLLTGNTQSRYVLLHPATRAHQQYIYLALVSFMVLVAAFVGQSYFTGEADLIADVKSFWSDVSKQSPNNLSDVAEQMKSSAASIIGKATATVSSDLEISAPTEESIAITTALVDVQASATSLGGSVVTAVSSAHDSAASLAESVLPTAITNAGASAASVLDSAIPTVASSAASIVQSVLPSLHRLQEVLNLHPEETKAVVVQDVDDGGLNVNVHHDKDQYLAQDPEAKHWDELHEDQKHYWRQRLIGAGRWAEHEGEAVFKGVLWSQYAGLVGAAAGEVLREL
ncbi:hypothetical protein AMS68_003872 [Peltaster fructicola]|uniref:Guanine nucleotide-exchange factor SEC12 n=1 Tax=Peltaster fructicola TaxID=286661 RepID=A0A6H0XUM7_9PEZI|nr:hypothetical protein AMS68_003872 [Peltaster fructicola]